MEEVKQVEVTELHNLEMEMETKSPKIRYRISIYRGNMCFQKLNYYIWNCFENYLIKSLLIRKNIGGKGSKSL